jgi:hypothetical protein
MKKFNQFNDLLRVHVVFRMSFFTPRRTRGAVERFARCNMNLPTHPPIGHGFTHAQQQ